MADMITRDEHLELLPARTQLTCWGSSGWGHDSGDSYESNDQGGDGGDGGDGGNAWASNGDNFGLVNVPIAVAVGGDGGDGGDGGSADDD